MAASGAAVLAIAAIVWGLYILMHQEYGTLFAQLSEGDAGAIVDALKKQKVPYRLEDGGTTIAVPAERVHETRLALMTGNVSLSGGVGFEIFDKQGMGATEQSQRVSYQRALQGELARSIAALDNVKQARVHLVLPESTLFKRDRQEATAAVTVTMKPGNTLDRQQIAGVQRLVAASVAGLNPSRVVITDQRGVTLSASSPTESSAGSVEARLEVQRQVEAHIAQKIVRLLDSAVGPGQAIVSVTAAISFDAIKTTTQDLLPVRGSSEQAIVRKRQVINGVGNDNAAATGTDVTERRSSSTLEVDYEYGRRVEEVIAAPGALRRLTVGVIVPPRIGEDQQRRIVDIVQVAAGIDLSRGDIVSVQPLSHVANGVEDELSDGQSDAPVGKAVTPMAGRDGAKSFWRLANLTAWEMTVVLAIALVLVGALLIVARSARERSLSDAQREQLLQEIRRTLGEDARVQPSPIKQ